METVVSLSVALLGIPFVTAAKSGSSATDNSKTASKSGFNLGEMDAVDYLRSGALVVAFLATAFHGKATWMKADTFMLAAFGSIWYFFPKPLLEYQTHANLDHIHVYFGHIIGAFYLGFAYTSHCNQSSKCNSVLTAQFLIRAIASMVLVQFSVLNFMKAAADSQRFSIQFVTFGMVFWALMAIGNLVCTLKYGALDGTKINLKDKLNRHILFEIILYTCLGMANVGFPHHLLPQMESSTGSIKPDGIHAQMMHTVGISMVCYIVMYGIIALGFEEEAAKKAHLYGRIVTYSLALPVVFIYQLKYQYIPREKLMFVFPFVTLLPYLNACYAVGLFSQADEVLLRRFFLAGTKTKEE